MSIFQKSFETKGHYAAYLKSGFMVAYTHRSEVWKDKFNCWWVSLFLDSAPNGFIQRLKQDDEAFEVRINEISGVRENNL